MPTETVSRSSQPIGRIEYELTDDLAAQASLTLFRLQIERTKASLAQKGAMHPALPIVVVSAQLIAGIVLVLIFVDDPAWKWSLVISACLVQLLLVFKLALYFWPSFARWYTGRQARRVTRKLAHRHITWTFHEDRLETESAAVKRTVPWTHLRRLLLFPDFWFLVTRSGLHLSFPNNLLPSEFQSLIRRKAEEANASVEDREHKQA